MYQGTCVLLMSGKLRKSGEMDRGGRSLHLCPLSCGHLPPGSQACGPVSGQRREFDFTLCSEVLASWAVYCPRCFTFHVRSHMHTHTHTHKLIGAQAPESGTLGPSLSDYAYSLGDFGK